MPQKLFVLMDSIGYVGVFTDKPKAEAAAKTLNQSTVLLIYQREDSKSTKAYVIPFRAGLVAFVTDNPASARAARDALVAIGASFSDDIRFWETPLNSIHPRCLQPAVNIKTDDIVKLLGSIDMAEKIKPTWEPPV